MKSFYFFVWIVQAKTQYLLNLSVQNKISELANVAVYNHVIGRITEEGTWWSPPGLR